MINIEEVCLKTGIHTCSLNKKYHVFSSDEIRQIIDDAIKDHDEKIKENIWQLRQWLNEDRVTDSKKMVTDKQLLMWLDIKNHEQTTN